MNMKTNTIIVGITMMLLLALPAAASDYTLGVFGNANEDDTINMQDVTYTELIILEYRDETELSDAKYDGKINMQDVTQIELVILGKEKEIAVLDSKDRIVIVDKPLERIVTHHSGAVEAMRSLGVEPERLAGVSGYVIEDSVFFPEFGDHPSTGRWPLDVENAIVLNPDAVFLYASVFHDEQTKQLEDAGVTVLRFDLYQTGDIYIDEIRKIGYIIDRREESEEFIEFYEGCIDAISEKVDEIPEDDKPGVYFEYSRYRTVGGDTGGWPQNIAAAGGSNIFSDLSGYADVSAESVIDRDPDIIVRLEHGGSGVGYGADDSTALEEMRNEILGRDELADVTAVKEEQVYTTCDDIYSGAQCFIGITYTAKLFHPTIFEDLDPQAVHQEYLTRFQGLDYVVEDHEVFIYPLPEES
jgi:iron complex transport system substrate-binding protein